MEDKHDKEFGVIFIDQETKFSERFFMVNVLHQGIPTDAVPHLPFPLTTTSIDELRSFLTALGVNGYCSNHAETIYPTSMRPCTEISEVPANPRAINDFIDQIMQWLTESDNHLELTVGDISEKELKNRLKHWQEAKQKNQFRDMTQ